jgi:hypothetical protein
MPIRKVKEYPIYQLQETGLYAFMDRSDMYQITNRGSNNGAEGVVINHFITRKMVMKHLRGEGYDIDVDTFRGKYNALFGSLSLRLTGR